MSKNQRSAEPKLFACPIQTTLSVLGGKWKLRILYTLQQGPQRYGAIKRTVEGISEKMLIQSLRELEDDGIVSRHAFHTVPPHVEYQLTPAGEALRPVFQAMYTWANQYKQALVKA